MEWQPIETAPTDGTCVLLCGGTFDDYAYYADASIVPPQTVVVGCKNSDYYRENTPSHWIVCSFDNDNGWVHYENPSHWMPLPPLPSGVPSNVELYKAKRNE
ncbi:DUF551 domain-containing protein [Rhodobacter capsulatus]|uniref:DUF551 domain-containing protein n=1 Tax=Rhodobacter capsulatus TaxID=1061 RepID=UPI00402A31B3